MDRAEGACVTPDSLFAKAADPRSAHGADRVHENFRDCYSEPPILIGIADELSGTA